MRINTDKPYRIFAEVLEQGALDQFESAMQQPFAVKGALMPDAHFGYSLPIGAVVATEGVIVPAWVGYDIGCGMCAVRTSFRKEDIIAHAKEIFAEIYKAIPTGTGNHNQKESYWDYSPHPCTPTLEKIFDKNGCKQLCSLGDGNHFIEIGYDRDGQVWVIVHSGSRGIGWQAARHYMCLASGTGKPLEGHFGFHEDSPLGVDYLMDLDFCLAFALENRVQIIERVCHVIAHHCGGWRELPLINRNHNHAEKKDGLWIHRKGATHAEEGMMGVIPGNMRDGSFIVRGKGNPDALWSSSHGAGRVLGRKEAERTLSLVDFAVTMQGVTAKVQADTLDEAPDAYKNIFDVMAQQADLVEVVAHVRPLINIKG